MEATELTSVLRDACHGPAAATACVVSDGAPVTAAAGTADPDTTFAIGSLTNVMTATMVCQLVASGFVRLDERIVRRVPEVASLGPDAGDITVRMLLCHNAGLADLWQRCAGFGELIAAVAKADGTGTPGEVHSYSSPGYVLLGKLIENITGSSWRRQLRYRILDPLEATSVSFTPPHTVAHDHVFNTRGSLVRKRMWPRVGQLWAPAGSTLHGDATDIARIAHACATGRADNGHEVLPRELADEMRTMQTSLPGYPLHVRGWGLGWALARTTDGVRHQGNTSAFVYADDERAVAVLTNFPRGQQIGEQVMDTLFDTPEPPPLRGPGPTEPNRLAGTYRSPTLTLNIRAVANQLVTTNPYGGGDVPLRHQESDTFWADFGDLTSGVSFFDHDRGGRPSRLHTVLRVLHRVT